MKWIGVLAMTSVAVAATPKAPAKPAASAPKAAVRPAARKPVAARKAAPAVRKPAARRTPTAVARRYPAPVAPVKVRTVARETVNAAAARFAAGNIENAGALVPFFEQLYRHQLGLTEGPLRILHYGDSHTAADEWTGGMRQAFQARFGDGGSGYTFAGRPWNSYRRLDVKGWSTPGWYTDGLIGRNGDGRYGLGGIAMTASRPRETVYLVADGEKLEVYYLQQPGGGAINVYDNGVLVEQVSTAGELGPGYYVYLTTSGTHRFEIETVEYKPVRLFGWAVENAKGVTYETLGINGAQASIAFAWDEALLADNIGRRSPALIVLAYGTNEARNKDWTPESYRDMFLQLLERFRKAAPAASILVLGPPDQAIQMGRSGWAPAAKLDMIVDAQREAAAQMGCAFWDLRARMGGKGAMRNWVLAGMAQGDYVHFTTPGYKLIGEALYRDLMAQYEEFLDVRARIAAAPAAGQH
jgi:lysophospholipase L1-like esterase